MMIITTIILIIFQAAVDQPTNDGLSPLHIASAKGDKAVVEQLCRHKAEVNGTSNFGSTPLDMCIQGQQGHSGVVELLVANKANVEQWHTRCLVKTML